MLRCIHVSMYPCIHVSLYPCIHVSVYPCISVSVYPCIHVSMYPCIHVSIHPCIPCIRVSLYPCSHVSMYTCIQYIHISMYPMCPCIHISMYPCNHVSLYPCIHASMHLIGPGSTVFCQCLLSSVFCPPPQKKNSVEYFLIEWIFCYIFLQGYYRVYYMGIVCDCPAIQCIFFEEKNIQSIDICSLGGKSVPWVPTFHIGRRVPLIWTMPGFKLFFYVCAH